MVKFCINVLKYYVLRSKIFFFLIEGYSLTTTVPELSHHLSEPVMQNSPTSACKYNHYTIIAQPHQH